MGKLLISAQSLWLGIKSLLGCGRDELQIFDLSSKAAMTKQDNDTIEIYYGKLNMLWKEIDRRMPNPMTCSKDITEFNRYIQRQRLYQFLTGIHDNLDKERREILNREPLPTVETAYATIRREISRRSIMNGTSSREQIPQRLDRDWPRETKHSRKAEKKMTGENSGSLTVEGPDIQRRDASNLWDTPSGRTIYRKGKSPPRHRQAGPVARLTLALPINQHHVIDQKE